MTTSGLLNSGLQSIIIVLALVACEPSGTDHKNDTNKENPVVIKQKESALNINDSIILNEVKKYFSYADNAIEKEYKLKIEPEGNLRFDYAEKLANETIFITASRYNEPHQIILFDTVKLDYKEIILTKLFERIGRINKVYGLSFNQDYLLISTDNSHKLKLYLYDWRNDKSYDVESFMEDRDIIFKKTDLWKTNIADYSFLPDLVASYGDIVFTPNNGFKIQYKDGKHYKTNKDKLFEVEFSSLNEMLDLKLKKQAYNPIIRHDEKDKQELAKHVYFGNYYAELSLLFEQGKLYNVPRSNIPMMFGLQEAIFDESEPYLFLAYHYYLHPETLEPSFNQASSRSDENQVRFTGLLIADKDSFELKAILVHGVGVQHMYKRYDHFLATSIYSDTKENHLVIWDLNSFNAVIKLNTGRQSNYMRNVIFDEKNNQIIAIHTNPAKIFVWDYFPHPQ